VVAAGEEVATPEVSVVASGYLVGEFFLKTSTDFAEKKCKLPSLLSTT
jgi:hypothetical protein